MELFASQQQHIMQLHCSKHLNNAFRFFWKAMGLAYANRPFSLLAKVLTKVAYEGGRVVMCTPDWGCSGEHAYWRPMLDRMTVGRVQLPDGPIHFLSVYFFSIAPSDGQCRTTSQKMSRPGLVAFGRISPKFEHLPWLALIVPPTLFHRRRRHFSSLPTSSPTSQFPRERAYFHATMFPSPYTLLGWSNASIPA